MDNNSIINNLESKIKAINNTVLLMTSQGYLVNTNDINMFAYSAILIHAFNHIKVLGDDAEKKLIELYNKLNEM